MTRLGASGGNPNSDQWLVALDARAKYQEPVTPTSGAAVTNFARRLPAADSALARDTLKILSV